MIVERHPKTACDLRVLLTTDAVGGVFTYTATFARGLCAAGATVTVVIQGPPADDARLSVLRDIAGVEVVTTDLDVEWRDPAGRDAARARRTLERLAARLQPDIVHLCGFREALAGFDAPVVITAHSCVGSWWQACRGSEPDTSWDDYTRDVRAGLDAAAAWIAPSHAFREVIEQRYAPRTRGHVVPNGIAPITPGRSGRAVVISAGRLWDEAKDVATVAAAANQSRWPIEIAGPRTSPNGADADTDGQAHFVGELAHRDLLTMMSDAGIFVSAAVYEPFGLSVLEAAGSGCALVLSDIPTFREIWGDDAFFFAPRDARDLARQINRLADDAHLRTTMRDRAIVRATRYSATRTTEGTRAVYESVLSSHRTPALRESIPA